MENPTRCQAVNSKLLTDTYPGPSLETSSALSVLRVNPTPPSRFHVQNCYRDTTVVAGTYFILDTLGPQYLTPFQMNTPMRWSVTTNSGAPAAMSVELTLVDSSNNEAVVTLVTNGITPVFTPLSIYKNCNDIKLVSNHLLTTADFIIAAPDPAVALNNVNTILTATAKFNSLFMCCNHQDGTPRQAKLIGLPQILSGALTNYRLYKWQNSNSGTLTASVIYSVFNVNSATIAAPGFKRRVQTPINGQTILLPGEACAWWRDANSNALAAVVAQWEYNPTV